MNIHFIFEAIGYAGSLLIIISMLMTSVMKLRIINSAGCLVFMVYAICIKSYPTAFMQLALMIINLVNIRKLFLTKKNYSVIKITLSDAFFTYFMDMYRADIQKYFPDVEQTFENHVVYLTCSGEVPAGILIAKQEDENSLNVKIEYATPAYRDCSVGKFTHKFLQENGIKKMTAQTENPVHQKYLKKMGFVADGSLFQKTL